MSVAEFEGAAEGFARDAAGSDRAEAIARSCRGSGNPAVLAWLSEALRLDDRTRVLDVGGGTGGPAAWLTDRYGCPVLVSDYVSGAAAAAASVFDLAAVAADGLALPLRDDAVDVALGLGVLSVVPDPAGLLAEVARVAARLGLLVYVSEGDAAVECGGSRFPTVDELVAWLSEAGWDVDAEPVAPDLPPPPTWEDDAEAGADHGPTEDEAAVAAEIDAGRIAPVVLTAQRR